MSSAGGATPMARAPNIIVATAVTLTATVPNAVCSRWRLGVTRAVLTVLMVIVHLLWLALSSPLATEIVSGQAANARSWHYMVTRPRLGAIKRVAGE
jgi:hypothetical protein